MLIIPPFTQCVQKCHLRSFNNGYSNKKTRFKRALGNFYGLFLSSQIFYILISLEAPKLQSSPCQSPRSITFSLIRKVHLQK